MLRLYLRLQRGSLIGMSAAFALLGLIQAGGFAKVAGNTPAERAAFGAQMKALAAQVAYLIPLPIHPETMAGYVHWRYFGVIPIFIAVWAVLSASAAARGDEQRRLTEIWLATGLSRSRLVAGRHLVFAGVAAVAIAAGSLGAALGAASDPLPWDRLLGQSAAAWTLAVSLYAIAFAVSQLAGTRSAAASYSGVVVAALFLLDSLSRINDSFQSVARISPFHRAEKTTVLAPGGVVEWESLIALLLLAVLLAAGSALAFQLRDVGSPLFRRGVQERPPQREPARNPLLARPVAARLWMQRWGLVAWTLAMAGLGLFEVQLTRSAVDVLLQNPALKGYLSATGGGNPYQAYVGLAWFGFALLIICAYVITQAAAWAAEDSAGRLELELSTPRARWQVVAERAMSAGIGVTIVAGAAGLAVWVEAAGLGLGLDGRRYLVATMLLLPFGLAFAGLGALLVGFQPRWTVPVLGVLAAASYFALQLGPIFQLPDWLVRLSLFKLYGNPLTAPVDQAGLFGMVLIAVAGFGLALLAMQRRDVGR